MKNDKNYKRSINELNLFLNILLYLSFFIIFYSDFICFSPYKHIQKIKRKKNDFIDNLKRLLMADYSRSTIY